MTTRFLLPFCALLLAVGPALRGSAAEGGHLKLKLTEAAVDGAVKERNVERFKSYFAADALFLTDSLHRGPEEIAAAWELFFAEQGPKVAHHPERFTVAGNLAYVVGTVTVTQEASGRTHERQGKYLNAWRRDEEGRWKLLASGTLVVCAEEACDASVDWRKGLSTVWEPLQRPDEESEILRQSEARHEADGLAVEVGTYTVTVSGEASSASASGGYLSVLHQDAEGAWQVVAESFSLPH